MDYQGAPAPPTTIFTLPCEIISTIFELVQHISGPPQELVLTHICARWRAIAFNTPLLWSIVDSSMSVPIEMTKTYLSRCFETYPLDASFEFTSEDADQHITGLIIFSTLVPHIKHCQSLRIRTSERLMSYIHRSLQDVQAPLLRYLSICVVDGNHLDRSDDFTTSILLGGSPELKLLHLGGCRPLIECYPPLSTVTTLHFHQCYSGTEYPTLTYQQFRRIIGAVPFLSQLSIHGELITDWPEPAGGGQAHLTNALNLTSLYLKFIPIPSQLLRLFSLLDAPKLHSIGLISIGDWDMMAAFYKKPFYSVRCLTLETQLSIRMYMKLNEFLPSITTLKLRGLSSSHVHAFLRQSSTWPELRTLELCSTDYRVNGDELIDFIDTRMKLGRPSIGLKVLREDFMVPPGCLLLLKQKAEVEVLKEDASRERWWEAMIRVPWWLSSVNDPLWVE